MAEDDPGMGQPFNPDETTAYRPSDLPPGPGWWKASDGEWYPPEQAAGAKLPPPPPERDLPPHEGWWKASDGNWYAPEQAAGFERPTPPPLPIPPPAPAQFAPPPPSSFAAGAPPVAAAQTSNKKRGCGTFAIIAVLAILVIPIIGIAVIAFARTSSPGIDSDEAIEVRESEPETAAPVEPDEDPTDDEASAIPDESSDDSEKADDSQADPSIGTRESPHAFDAPVAMSWDVFGDADNSVWNTTINEPTDITSLVMEENSFNDPPPEGFVFAGFDVAFTLANANKVPLSTGFNLSFEIVGGDSLSIYDEFTAGASCGVTPNEFNQSSEVLIGGTLTGSVCIPIPVEDLTHPDTRLALNFSGDRQHFGVDGIVGEAAAVPGENGATGTEAGSIPNPHPYDQPSEIILNVFGDADGSVWVATISPPEDITQAVLTENQFNDAPNDGQVFAGWQLELTLVEAAKEPLSSGFNISFEMIGGSSAGVYGQFTLASGCGVVPDEFDEFAEVLVGGTLSGTVCIPIPLEDLSDPGTRVAINAEGARTNFGPTS